MRVLSTAAVIALLAGPAYGQAAVPRYGEVDKGKSPAEIAAEKAAERAYKNSLQNIPEKGPADPWGNVRSDNTPKDAAKAAPAKQQTKTGSAAKQDTAK